MFQMGNDLNAEEEEEELMETSVFKFRDLCNTLVSVLTIDEFLGTESAEQFCMYYSVKILKTNHSRALLE